MFTSFASHAQFFNNALSDSRRVAQCMFPKPNYAPTFSLERSNRGPVAANVAENFLPPVTAISDRHAAMLRASMPKTTINENGNPLSAENKIRTTGKRLMPLPTRNAGTAQDNDNF
jgi:hypothetical protein